MIQLQTQLQSYQADQDQLQVSIHPTQLERFQKKELLKNHWFNKIRNTIQFQTQLPLNQVVQHPLQVTIHLIQPERTQMQELLRMTRNH